MSQRFKALVSAEDLGLVSSTYIQLSKGSVPRNPVPFSDYHRHKHICGDAHTYMQAICVHIKCFKN